MLKVNSYGGYYLQGKSGPYWVGLGAGTFNVTFEWKHSYERTNCSIISGSFQPSQEPCPLALNPYVYERVAKNLDNETGLELFAPTTIWEEDGMQANKTVFALLLSELHVNTSLFADTKPLIDLRVLGQRGSSSCASSSYNGNGGIYTGEYWEPRHSVNFFPLYQFLSSALLTVWGLMLLFASYPLKRLMIRGSLDQWMLFSADLCMKEMRRASSGHRGASGNTVWGLRSTIADNGVGRLELRRVIVPGAVEEMPKLKMGTKYA